MSDSVLKNKNILIYGSRLHFLPIASFDSYLTLVDSYSIFKSSIVLF